MRRLSAEMLRCKTAGNRTDIDGYYSIKHHKIANYYYVVVASSGLGWDHVSVHLTEKKGNEWKLVQRTPTWAEMCWIKDFFFAPDEVAIQFHPRKEDYVNVHPYVLHLWRPHGVEMPTPELIMV